MEAKYFVPVLVLVVVDLFGAYCATTSSTTAWPELGARGHKPPTTPAPPRDFVSQPSAWSKPLVHSNNKPSTPQQSVTPRPSSNHRDYVNPNLSNTPVTQAAPPRRDYVNPNVQLPSNKPAGSMSPQAVTSATTSSPRRDYVNPNAGGKLSYSNVASNSKDTRPRIRSTTPASRIGGSSTSRNEATTANPKIRENENQELQEFSEALLRKDTNNGFKYVKVNYQGLTRSSSLKDEAPENLMTIDPNIYKLPTVEKLVALHNNYIVQSNQNEVYTAQERIEENNFLEAILPTSVMQHTRNFLISKGKISKDPKDFRDLLRTIWFGMYSRGGGKVGSSGFEHVYLAEIKNEGVSGLHNWLYFSDEEKKRTLNYLGYMKKLEFDKGAILKLHFNFQNIDKPVGSMFIGTSPELELALYSACFLVRPDDVCPLRLGGKNFVIRTYTYRYRGKNMIGSAFPEI